ncbi:MAG: hypothetical protein ABIH92_04305 [Nanoarchaeota archaeon]
MHRNTIIPLVIAGTVAGAIGLDNAVDGVRQANEAARRYAVIGSDLTPAEIADYRSWSEATGQEIIPSGNSAILCSGSSERVFLGFRPHSLGWNVFGADNDGDGDLEVFSPRLGTAGEPTRADAERAYDALR